ncbi:MAG TPA: 16S rRNA (uracil(1498)-N(3))-methyltransferase [Afifellaceae bacterium]|nr:16S rRNA (uracil(1498)-N(3))-methyltransferase [Afifellaceae bacterium]
MPYDFRAQRLFVDAPLSEGVAIEAARHQAHYLLTVLRLKPGDAILLFNGRDGEWRARIAAASKKGCVLEAEEQVRPQPPRSDLHYLFAPLKQARLDYMVEKAVEMGAGRLRPVLTQHTQVTRLNLDRMHANAIEAAEQCGILSLPEIEPPGKLETVLAGWPEERRLVFCDEAADAANPIDVLSQLPPGPLALLVGPEGGFSIAERRSLLALPFVTAISLGPRVLRADTAAVAALALLQAVCGDWR